MPSHALQGEKLEYTGQLCNFDVLPNITTACNDVKNFLWFICACVYIYLTKVVLDSCKDTEFHIRVVRMLYADVRLPAVCTNTYETL